jgi:hypothetical protein
MSLPKTPVARGADTERFSLADPPEVLPSGCAHRLEMNTGFA